MYLYVNVVWSVSKWLFSLCNIVVINWLNKQMNDQMMSQQRLGPFEMHTKPVSTRGPPLVPYNKVCQIILFAFFLIIISSIVFNLLILFLLLLLSLSLYIIIIDIVIIIITINIAMIVILSSLIIIIITILLLLLLLLLMSLLLLGDEHNSKLHHLNGKQNRHSTFLGASPGRFILVHSLL